MLKNLKITTKLLVIVALLTTIAVLTIGYVGIHMAKKSTINTQITMLGHIANLKADKIESFFNERRADIKITQGYFNIKANLPIVTQFAADRTNPAYITAKKMLDSQIKTFTDVNECYVDFMLVNPEGKVMYSANELHAKKDLDNPLTGLEGEKAFEQGKKGVYFSDVYVSEFEDYVYGRLITAPVLDFNGQFIGVVAFAVNMDHIYKFLQYTTGMGETGEILIGKKVEDGALFVNPLRHDKDAALKRKAIFGEKSSFPILEAVQGRNGSGLSIDYRGKEVVAAGDIFHHPIVAGGW
ncbi:MAG: cache domain-containing protein [Candidatus Anammoxibacter sp.]